MNLYRRKPPALSIARFTAGCWQTVVLASEVEWGSNLSWANASTAVHQGYTSTKKKLSPAPASMSEARANHVTYWLGFVSEVKSKMFFFFRFCFICLYLVYTPRCLGTRTKKGRCRFFVSLVLYPWHAPFFSGSPGLPIVCLEGALPFTSSRNDSEIRNCNPMA